MNTSTAQNVIPFPDNNFKIMYLSDKEQNLEQKKVKEPKLKKDGQPKNIKSNKKEGVKSEVYPFEIEDAKKIVDYFYNSHEWQCYLIFIIQCNTARRIGDLLQLQWKHLFNPVNGKIRTDMLEIKEQKTDKLANPHINSACKKAIELYIEKTGIEIANCYEDFVFIQTKGNFKGRVLTADGYRKQLKKAAAKVGIDYNVGTHSARKFFGKMSRMLHPNDYDSMELLQTIYNHSDSKTTKHYIGLTKQKIDSYYNDMGVFFDDYVTGDKTYESVSTAPIISLDVNDLRSIIALAYKAGSDNAKNTDSVAHIEAINKIMSMVENLER